MSINCIIIWLLKKVLESFSSMNKTVEVMRLYRFSQIDNRSYEVVIDVELKNAAEFAITPLTLNTGRVILDGTSRLLKSFQLVFKNLTQQLNLKPELMKVEFDNINIAFDDKSESFDKKTKDSSRTLSNSSNYFNETKQDIIQNMVDSSSFVRLGQDSIDQINDASFMTEVSAETSPPKITEAIVPVTTSISSSTVTEEVDQKQSATSTSTQSTTTSSEINLEAISPQTNNILVESSSTLEFESTIQSKLSTESLPEPPENTNPKILIESEIELKSTELVPSVPTTTISETKTDELEINLSESITLETSLNILSDTSSLSSETSLESTSFSHGTSSQNSETTSTDSITSSTPITKTISNEFTQGSTILATISSSEPTTELELIVVLNQTQPRNIGSELSSNENHEKIFDINKIIDNLESDEKLIIKENDTTPKSINISTNKVQSIDDIEILTVSTSTPASINMGAFGLLTFKNDDPILEKTEKTVEVENNDSFVSESPALETQTIKSSPTPVTAPVLNEMDILLEINSKQASLFSELIKNITDVNPDWQSN